MGQRQSQWDARVRQQQQQQRARQESVPDARVARRSPATARTGTRSASYSAACAAVSTPTFREPEHPKELQILFLWRTWQRSAVVPESKPEAKYRVSTCCAGNGQASCTDAAVGLPRAPFSLTEQGRCWVHCAVSACGWTRCSGCQSTHSVSRWCRQVDLSEAKRQTVAGGRTWFKGACREGEEHVK